MGLSFGVIFWSGFTRRGRPAQLASRKRPSGYGPNNMAPGRLTLILLWLVAAATAWPLFLNKILYATEAKLYDSVRHMKPSMAGAELQLTCDVIHEKCPAFKYGNEGPSNQCVYDDVPDVLDNVLHHAIPPDGPGLREVTYGSQKLVVENTCFYAGNRARIDDARDQKRGLCKYAGSWREYLEKLGVVGRDTAAHPWGE